MPYVPESRRLVPVVVLAVLTLLVGLGGTGSTRLTYHEAIVAQGAREMLARGDWLVPTINNRPWIEKPPLAHWLTMLASIPGGAVTEWTTRLPSALSAMALALAVTCFVTRRYGSTAGLLAGLVQATTYWTVIRGRLADADILLAALVTCTLVVFDWIRQETLADRPPRRAVFLFFLLIGATSLAKGVGFGAALILASMAVVLIWDRDRSTFQKLINPGGIAAAALIALAWPLLLVARHPEAFQLWTLHVADRLADKPAHFAGGPWWSYPVAAVGMVLPWTPIALIGLVRSARRAWNEPNGPDRLLIAWAFAPLVLLSFATVKNAHYAIYALPPWSAWTALGLIKIGQRWQAKGWSPARQTRIAISTFFILGLAYAITFSVVMPRYDERGKEWAFYQQVSKRLDPKEPLVFLLDDWDRLPYQTPFGPVPHDLAVRLFYLNRTSTSTDPQPTTLISLSPDSLVNHPPTPGGFALIARDRDLDRLKPLGPINLLADGPSHRWDRVFQLYRLRITPEPAPLQTATRPDPSSSGNSALR